MVKFKQFINLYLILIFINGCAGPYNAKVLEEGVFVDDNFNITISDGWIHKMPFLREKERKFYKNRAWVDMRYQSSQHTFYSLSSEDRNRHRLTIMSALNSGSYSTKVWVNRVNRTKGMVRIRETFPISSGICKYYQVLVQKKTKALTDIYLACKYIGSETWFFNYYWDWDY